MRLRDRRPQRWVVLILVLAASAIALGASVAATGGKSAAAKLHAPPPAWADPDLATVTSDNFGQQFTGAFTDLGCGSTDVIADPASTINVTVSADTPTNDLMVNLVYLGNVVKNEDTGVGQETFVYSVSALAGGVYSIQVCESGNPATPLVQPYTYTGVYSDIDVATPTAPYPPPGSTTNPVTVTPTPKYGNWNATFSSSTVVDPQRTEGEPLTFVPGDGTILESGPWGTSDEQLLRPSLDQRRQGVPSRRRHGPASRSAARRRRHGHRGRRPGNDVLQRSRGADESQHRRLERQRDDMEEEPGVDSEHARGRPPVVRRGQRQLLVGLGQHDLLRLPPDGSRDVHLLLARLDRAERSRGRPRLAELGNAPGRNAAAGGRRDLREAALRPRDAQSLLRV